MKPEFSISEIADIYIRKNFERLRDFLNNEPNLDGFRAFQVTFTATNTAFKFTHRLGFLPKDVIITSLTGTGTVVFNYSRFTATELDLTIGGTVSTTAPTVVRFLVGTLSGVASS